MEVGGVREAIREINYGDDAIVGTAVSYCRLKRHPAGTIVKTRGRKSPLRLLNGFSNTLSTILGHGSPKSTRYVR